MNGGAGDRLPEPTTSFVGREAELDALARTLERCRLLTIAGGAGLGKTRLATALAVRLSDVPVRFVGLSDLTDGALLPSEVAARLDVPDEPGSDATAALAGHIGGRSLLLLLDNCEHVVEASAGLVESLLQGCPGLRVLVTSQQPLRVPGEVVWRISPLRLPDPRRGDDLSAVAGSEAVRLIEARAQAALPGFRVTRANAGTVAALCRRLEGIPLAIELAAVRLNELSIEEVLVHLEDRFRLLGVAAGGTEPRHRTLEAALGWSHHLLDDRERRLFRRVSVFSGGFDLESAEAICAGDGIEQVDVPRMVVRLVAKSLVTPEIDGTRPTRYRQLETVRQYGAQRLRESAERAALMERHAGHFLAVAERAAHEERGLDQPGWLERLELDHDNFRTTLAWLRARDAGAWLRLATALAWFWTTRGHFSEGRHWLEGALAAAGERHPARADGHLALARLCFWQGDGAASRASCERCLELREAQGDPVGSGWALVQLGSVHAYAGEFGEGRACFERALGGTDDVLVRMEALVGLGEMLLLAGDPVGAREPLRQVAELARGPQAPRGRAALLLGLTALFIGDSAEARTQLDFSVVVFRALGNRYGGAASLDALACVAVNSGDPARALRLSGAASALRESTRSQLAPRWRDVLQALVIDPAMAALGDDGPRAWSEGRAMAFDEALSLAHAGAASRAPAGGGA